MKQDLEFYSNAFTKLRRDHKNGGAPHKPILLLAIFQAYKDGYILDNKIKITPELVGYFKDNWSALVETKHDCRFTLPFFHLSNEKANYWKLKPNLGFEKVIESKYAMRNFKSLLHAVKYVEIDKTLHELLISTETNDFLRMVILKKYFPNFDSKEIQNTFLEKIKKDILNDSSVEYAAKVRKIFANKNEDEAEEEIYVRSGQFKREVLTNYNNTCAISGLRINIARNISMLDACHIIPFSDSYDDTITNGISLTPTLHRAFDRGLISISNDYRVLIKNNFQEAGTSPYSIKQFEGKKITLPNYLHRYPSQDSLSYHRKKMMFSE